MFHVSTLKNRFKLRTDDYNKIAEYLNNLCGGIGIQIKRPDNPSASNPPVVEIDRGQLFDILNELLASKTPTNPAELTSGFGTGNPSADSTEAVFGAKSPGAKLKVCTRVTDDGSEYHFKFRTFTISADGRIVKISGETNGG